MRPTIFLFDVDGTLCRTGGAGGRAMRRAFDLLYGRADAMDVVDVRGNTDPLIIAEALRAIDCAFDQAAFARVMASYLDFLEDELARAPSYVRMPGVVELLDALDAAGGHAIGLGTGNVEAGARAKLRRGDLASRFAFGGYGSDAGDRAELLLCGAERGATLLGRPREESKVVVIGDTPRDVSAAKAIGAESIAVATGGFSVEALRETSPSLVVPTLEDAQVYALLGLPSPR